jgi:hypothetical protein
VFGESSFAVDVEAELAFSEFAFGDFDRVVVEFFELVVV